MLFFLVCGLTLLLTPNGKFEDHYVSPARGSFGQKQSVIIIINIVGVMYSMYNNENM